MRKCGWNCYVCRKRREERMKDSWRVREGEGRREMERNRVWKEKSISMEVEKRLVKLEERVRVLEKRDGEKVGVEELVLNGREDMDEVRGEEMREKIEWWEKRYKELEMSKNIVMEELLESRREREELRLRMKEMEVYKEEMISKMKEEMVGLRDEISVLKMEKENEKLVEKIGSREDEIKILKEKLKMSDSIVGELRLSLVKSEEKGEKMKKELEKKIDDLVFEMIMVDGGKSERRDELERENEKEDDEEVDVYKEGFLVVKVCGCKLKIDAVLVNGKKRAAVARIVDVLERLLKVRGKQMKRKLLEEYVKKSIDRWREGEDDDGRKLL